MSTTRDPCREAEFREQICAWLRANGLDPGDIPIGASVIVSDHWITTMVWQRDAQGDRKMNPTTGEPVLGGVTVPMLVPPEGDVANWVMPCGPTCGHAPATG